VIFSKSAGGIGHAVKIFEKITAEKIKLNPFKIDESEH
jgi:hypothetical protein